MPYSTNTKSGYEVKLILKRHVFMNNIDINVYTIEELMALNKKVVNRIKFLQKQSQLETAAKFSIGNIVSFIDEDGNKQEAMVTHINPKKIRAITLKKQVTWTISPNLLTLERKGEKADLLKLFDTGIKTKKI